MQTKLNMWQWLGLILLVVALAFYAYRNWIAPNKPSTDVTPKDAPTTTPVVRAPTTAPAR